MRVERHGVGDGTDGGSKSASVETEDSRVGGLLWVFCLVSGYFLKTFPLSCARTPVVLCSADASADGYADRSKKVH